MEQLPREINRVVKESMNFVDWGLIEYTEAANRQLELVEQVAAGSATSGSGASDTLIFCSHPPVVTTGRATKSQDLAGWRGDVIEVSRGGRATYHGPSQIVVYPILDLNCDRVAFRSRDLHGYMRALESAIVQTLGDFGVEAQGSETALQSSGTGAPNHDDVSRTGVWVANGDKKIASIGIACKKWVTYHGLALNVEYDPLAFSGINPCGMNASVMTSMELILGRTVERAAVTESLRESLAKKLLSRV